MKSFFAFFKKEWREGVRSGKILFLGILFLAFGIMNPAIAKLTPWLLKTLSDQLAQSGMSVSAVAVDALTSWTQFFKNIPMALIAFVLLYSSSLCRECESGTLLLLFTKGLPRYQALLAKLSLWLTLWTGGYWLCFAVTYAYNAYFWDNAIARSLGGAAVYWWLFGVFVLCALLFFSALVKSYATVLLGTGGIVLLSYLLTLLPRLSHATPTSLMSGVSLLLGAEAIADYRAAWIVTVVLCAGCIGASIPIFNKRQL